MDETQGTSLATWDSESIASESTDTSKDEQTHVPHVALTTVGFGGLQLVFATFSGQGVSHFKSVGLSKSQIAIALIIGPICGATFQPYFGSLSDHWRTPWGRRRPLIVVGTVFLIFSMLALAWVESATRLILSRTAENETYKTVLVILIMLFVFSMFTAVQAVQVGLRALLVDDCEPSQRTEANAWASRHGNLATFLAHLSAYLDLPRYIYRFGHTVFMDMTVLTTLCLSITILVVCLSTSEPQLKNRSLTSWKPIKRREICTLLLGSSNQIRTIYAVQFLSWMGWFPFLFYTATYVNSLGHWKDDSNSMDRQEASIGTLALLAYITVSLSMSVLLPYWASSSTSALRMRYGTWKRCLTISNLWIASHGIFAMSMFGTVLITSALGTVLLFSLVGVSSAAASWIPYSLLSAELSRPFSHSNDTKHVGRSDLSESVGLIYGLHNLAICLPQISMTSVMALVWMFSNSNTTDVKNYDVPNVVWFLRLGGVSALMAMYVATWIDDPLQDEGLMDYNYNEIPPEGA